MMLGCDDWTEATRQIARRNRYGRTDNDRMDHWWGLFNNRCPPTLGEGVLGRRPWRKDGLDRLACLGLPGRGATGREELCV